MLNNLNRSSLLQSCRRYPIQQYHQKQDRFFYTNATKKLLLSRGPCLSPQKNVTQRQQQFNKKIKYHCEFSTGHPNFSNAEAEAESTESEHSNDLINVDKSRTDLEQEKLDPDTKPQHAVVSTFDLLSIGIGPSSSHTVGPMRAGKIFVESLRDLKLLDKVSLIKVSLYGSLAATGKGHMSPQALLCGLEGDDPETVDTDSVHPRYDAIKENKTITLGGTNTVQFDMAKDMIWYWDRVLPQHPNGMRFSVFDENGDMLATNEYYSIGGGFVVNDDTQVTGGENVFYKSIHKSDANPSRREQSTVDSSSDSSSSLSKLPIPEESPCSSPAPSFPPPKNNNVAASDTSTTSSSPPMPFHSGESLLQLTRDYNFTIAQIAWENERAHYTDVEIRDKLLEIYQVMDECIRQGVSSKEDYLPGRLQVKRRAPSLYKRLTKGFYGPGESFKFSPADARAKYNDDDQAESNNGNINNEAETRLSPVSPQYLRAQSSRQRVRGRLDHPIPPIAPRRTVFSGMDMLSCYAIAVNEVNASGGRIVTAPTNGAAGVIPAVLKYFVEFISEDPERDVQTFLLTASAIGMLFKRGATISAAEGGCMAEVGVACSMAAAGYAACMGGSPEVIEQAAEIGIEHNLGLTCDPIDGLVQVPCIERNSLGAVKAVTAAQLALAGGDGSHSVSLDEAIAAMKVTAKDMLSQYKETSRSGLATSVRPGARISSAVPDC